ncbi:helix-turn-helix transcriptional regulator [Inquilinus sp. Marseille-Q2685]|uniref:helix-turn-helix transcriptional regulator n=1 Tax=Inquilinus sp. Marseille-Q2685 TaxID=2866581 RepID=UPI001CE43983|nr:helix-turn-helix transcriptional regulator [Inquilinus sp. Marseille-Q2685]
MASPPDGQRKALAARSGVGVTASVVQRAALRFSRLVIDRPTLIVLRHGTKTLHSASGEWSLRGGEAVAIAGGEPSDVSNRLSGDGLYEARWLVWDPALIARFEQGAAEGPALAGAAVLGRLEAPFASAFDRALEAIFDLRQIPDPVAKHRLAEILVWLAQRGVRYSAAESPALSTKVRRLFENALAERWTAAAVASRLALSEATLRRRLAAEGTSFGDLLADVRMSAAMLLLQATDQAVTRIALEVGYESPPASPSASASGSASPRPLSGGMRAAAPPTPRPGQPAEVHCHRNSGLHPKERSPRLSTSQPRVTRSVSAPRSRPSSRTEVGIRVVMAPAE